MVTIFQILAVILALATGYFVWQDNFDNTFASGVLAIVSFLLSVRFKIKARIKQRTASETANSRDSESP